MLPLRPLHAGERENAAGLVVGLDVGLHVVQTLERRSAVAADIESARLTPLAGVAFEEFRSTLSTPLPESTRGLLAREETAGMTTRFSGPPSLP